MPATYGICRLSLAPLRADADDRSEMVSQLIFGEHYQVIDQSEDSKWLKISTHFDGYQAWLDYKQHHGITEQYFKQINNSDYQITTDLSTSVFLNGESFHLVLGSIIPVAESELFNPSTLLKFEGKAKSLSRKLSFSGLKDIALKYLNAPYLWGGKSPWGVDCSGLVQMVFRIGGYKLPRDAYQQAEKGVSVNSLAVSQAGDLAFFAPGTGKINHVGIILEDNRIIHASGKVRIDTLSDQGIVDNGEITHRMSAIKRVLI